MPIVCVSRARLSSMSRGGGQAPSDRFPFLHTCDSAIFLFSRTPPSPPTLMSHTHSAGPSSPNFQLIFSNALRAYEKHTKNDLLSHPLTAQLQACQSPSSILAVLQQQAQELGQSRASNEKLTKWLEPTVNVLYAFSETIGGCQSGVSQDMSSPYIQILILFRQVFSPGKLIFAGVGILLSVRSPFPLFAQATYDSWILQAAKDVHSSQETLIDVFERIENFFFRLEVYTAVPATPEMMDMMVKIMVEVLSILGIATREIRQGRTSE